MKTKESQHKKITKHLFKFGHLSMPDAVKYYDIFRLSERIRELNKIWEKSGVIYRAENINKPGDPGLYELKKLDGQTKLF